jgi:hypothetical protein
VTEQSEVEPPQTPDDWAIGIGTLIGRHACDSPPYEKADCARCSVEMAVRVAIIKSAESLREQLKQVQEDAKDWCALAFQQSKQLALRDAEVARLREAEERLTKMNGELSGCLKIANWKLKSPAIDEVLARAALADPGTDK